MSRNRQNVFTNIGLKKYIAYAIVLSIEDMKYSLYILLVDDRGSNWKISDRSIKFHVKYILPTFSYVNTALIDYDFLKCNTRELKIDVSKYYNRQSNE